MCSVQVTTACGKRGEDNVTSHASEYDVCTNYNNMKF